MNARLAAYPDCGNDYVETLAQAAGEMARGEGWDVSPPDLLEMAASVLPGRPELTPPVVTLSKVIDRYVALRRQDGLDHDSAVRAIRHAIERATPSAI